MSAIESEIIEFASVVRSIPGWPERGSVTRSLTLQEERLVMAALRVGAHLIQESESDVSPSVSHPSE